MNYTNRSTPRLPLRSGYDLPVYGLDNGHFLHIHVPAVICISISLVSAICVLIASFRHQNIRTFFTWSKAERFVVYLALCDALFNLSHSLDHIHVIITEMHVHPPELCTFYSMMLIEFVTAQHILVNIICINAFVIVFREHSIFFGIHDWRLLSLVFGIPVVVGIVGSILGVLGPNGLFCYIDRVKGDIAEKYFTTVPAVVITATDIVLYTLTWLRIRQKEPKLKVRSTQELHCIRASRRAACNMSLFVIAFIIQWWPSVVYGLWRFTEEDIPELLYQFATVFPNIGGTLNLFVYIIIRREKLMHASTHKGGAAPSSPNLPTMVSPLLRSSEKLLHASPRRGVTAPSTPNSTIIASPLLCPTDANLRTTIL